MECGYAQTPKRVKAWISTSQTALSTIRNGATHCVHHLDELLREQQEQQEQRDAIWMSRQQHQQKFDDVTLLAEDGSKVENAHF